MTETKCAHKCTGSFVCSICGYDRLYDVDEFYQEFKGRQELDNDISKKITDLISRHRVKRFTGQVTIVLNYSQGGVGTVEVVVKEVLK